MVTGNKPLLHPRGTSADIAQELWDCGHGEGSRGAGGSGDDGGEGGCYINTADNSNTAVQSSSVEDANLEHPTDSSHRSTMHVYLTLRLA